MTDITEERVLELIAENQGTINAAIGALVTSVDSFEAIITEFQSTILPTIQGEVASSSIAVDDINDNQIPSITGDLGDSLALLQDFTDVWLPSLQESAFTNAEAIESFGLRLGALETSGTAAMVYSQQACTTPLTTTATYTEVEGLRVDSFSNSPTSVFFVTCVLDVEHTNATAGDCVGKLVVDGVDHDGLLTVNLPQNAHVPVSQIWLVTGLTLASNTFVMQLMSEGGSEYLIDLASSLSVMRLS